MPHGIAPHNIENISEALKKVKSLNFDNRIKGESWSLALNVIFRSYDCSQSIVLDYIIEEVEDGEVE